MNYSIAKRILQDYAYINRKDHSYLPQTLKEAYQWEPHDWTIQAVVAAYELYDAPDCPDMPVEG